MRRHAARSGWCPPASARSAPVHGARCLVAPAPHRRPPGAGGRRSWSSPRGRFPASSWGSPSPSRRCRSRPGRTLRGAGSSAGRTSARWRRSRRRCGHPTVVPACSTALSGAVRHGRGWPAGCRRTGHRFPARQPRHRPLRGTAWAGRWVFRRSRSGLPGRSPCCPRPGSAGWGTVWSPGPACPRSGRRRWTTPGSACHPVRR
ncbi:hypothetical protein D3C80_1279000 [compost metagenome]